MQYHLRQAIIRPRRERQLELLRRAIKKSPLTDEELGIPIHVDGGYALKGDLQNLVDRGLLEKTRYEYRGFHKYPLSRMILRITELGREELAKHG